MQARLRGGFLNKARRGEYRCPLPTGLIYNEVGDVVLDPDAQIRQMFTHFFETFSRVGSLRRPLRRLPGRVCSSHPGSSPWVPYVSQK